MHGGPGLKGYGQGSGPVEDFADGSLGVNNFLIRRGEQVAS